MKKPRIKPHSNFVPVEETLRKGASPKPAPQILKSPESNKTKPKLK